MMEIERPKVLIVDDDPLHLDIYGLLVKGAGFHPIPALVRFSGLDPMPESELALVLLDYRLNSVKTAPELALEIRSQHPEAPIVVLSDLWTMPKDIEPYAARFVRKGEPEKLVTLMRTMVANRPPG